ncbi:phospholipid scramblase 1-like [Danio rerio]|uniref:Phospholipid scramblase n=1 Tax=Danio rerio TaxID=7955 RepID=A0A2R8S0G3_DANRE|nr:phospholipid scramblase 1-like [Danio rerio]|eukprot:XP_693207.5 phospholipid scramblase 1-like [Danio rerio]
MFLQGQTEGVNAPGVNVPMPPVYTIGHPPGVNEVYTTPPTGYVAPQVPAVMPVLDRPMGCPVGLEYLTQVDQLLVHQKVELMEVLMGWETNNQYVVKNSLGQQVFFAAEESHFCSRMFCGSVRSFLLHIQDNMGQEVMTLSRPLKCSSCFFPCCLQELEVHSPSGSPLGYVTQSWHPYLPKFIIHNERKEPVLKILGPFCDCKCCSDVNFEVMSLDESSVIGRISKQWSGFEAEAFTDADNFGLQFPMDLDVKIKAVILGACFLIDFMFFEHTQKQE